MIADVLLNSATGIGVTPFNEPVEDMSQDGVFPDPDGNGVPTDNDEPTPLPVDPSGVVYDETTRQPIEDAVVTLLYVLDGINTLVPDACLGTDQQGQSTDSTGEYRFDLNLDPPSVGCPASGSDFLIEIEPPEGYVFASSIAAEADALDPAACPNDQNSSDHICGVQAQDTAPQFGQSTTYYLTFTIASGDPAIGNNHIPLMQALGLSLSKKADKEEVSIGDLVLYTLTVENLGDVNYSTIFIEDTPAGGFHFVEDSAEILQGGETEAIQSEGFRPVTFGPFDIAGFETVEISYLMRVSSGVVFGEYKNIAVAQDNTGSNISNYAEEKVQVIPDPVLDLSTIIGKVYQDRDGDGWQDDADATDVVIEGGLLNPSADSHPAYISGSTEISRDGINWSPVPDASMPLIKGINLGDIDGRANEATDAQFVQIRQRIQSTATIGSTLVKSDEGWCVTEHADGSHTDESIGKVARGEVGQDLVLTRSRDSQADGTDILTLTIANEGIQERGIPGARLGTVTGLIIETDEWGRYHIPDVEGGTYERGRDFILKVDKSSLPAGAVFTTENPRSLRITPGLMTEFNFGVQLPAQTMPSQIVDVKIGEVFFDTDKATIRPEFEDDLDQLAQKIKEIGHGHLTIVGNADARASAQYNIQLGAKRARSVFNALKLRLGPLAREVDIDVEIAPKANTEAPLRERGPWERRDEPFITPQEPAVESSSTDNNKNTSLEEEPLSMRMKQTGTQLLSALLSLMIPAVEAAEETAQAQAPLSFTVVTQGEAVPRSENNSAENLQDNRRVDVKLRSRVELSDGGVLWASQYPSDRDLSLNVMALGQGYINTGSATESSDNVGPLAEPILFRVYSNYNRYIEKAELRLFRSGDTDLALPIAILSKDQAHYGEAWAWDGTVQGHIQERVSTRSDNGTLTFRNEETLWYTLRVYDAEGRYDETDRRELTLINQSFKDSGVGEENSIAQADALEAVSNIYGRDNTRVQRILVDGVKVRVHGEGLSPQDQLWVEDTPIPVADNGRFVLEEYVPAGEYDVTASVLKADGRVLQRPLSLDVTADQWFMVGLASLTVGEHDISGAVEPLAGDDHYDGSTFTDGRIAFYAKGRIKGKYLLTAQLDSTEDDLSDLGDNLKRKDPESIFRRLDPDQYYPVYGDDSTIRNDVDTQGAFYLKLEWDQSYALWGNYNTTITGTELASYNRSLYGAQYRAKSTRTTEFGDAKLQGSLFASEAQTAYAHNRFSSTGGSLYYLENTDIVRGSDKIWVEVREDGTERTLERIDLQEGRDYEIDWVQGRILLTRPLPQIAYVYGSDIVKNTPLGGNDILLFVDYEYLPEAFAGEDITAGGRGEAWIGDHVKVGGTYVTEERSGEDYELIGTDITVKFGEGTYITAEYAETTQQQTANTRLSNDGGLSFRDSIDDPDTPEDERATLDNSGSAYSVEARVNFNELTDNETDGDLTAWYKHRESGFGGSASISDGKDTKDMGVEGRWGATENLDLNFRATQLDKETSKETRYELGGRYRLNNKLELEAELQNDIRERDSAETEDSTVLGARLNWQATEGTRLYVQGQADLNRDNQSDNNNQATLGFDSRISQNSSLFGEVTHGDRGEAYRLGADYRINDGHTLYAGYEHSSESDGADGNLTLGQRKSFGNRLSIYNESQFGMESRHGSISNVYGLDWGITEHWTFTGEWESAQGGTGGDNNEDQQRDIYRVATTYRNDHNEYRGTLEYRKDRNQNQSTANPSGDDADQWLTTQSFKWRVNEDWRLEGRLNLSMTEDDNQEDLAKFTELNLGFAYRPIDHNRWNVLGRYTYTYDLQPTSQGNNPDERLHVLSTEVLYDINKRWELGAKVGIRYGQIRLNRNGEDWFDYGAKLGLIRARYHLNHKWDGIMEYRALATVDGDDLRQGALIGFDYHINNNLKIGAGYNFTDFSDDLTDLDYENRGWYFRILGKL